MNVKRIKMGKNAKTKDCFFGKHTEQTVWFALVNDKSKLGEYVNRFTKEGSIMYRVEQGKSECAALSFPDKGPVQALSLIENSGNGFELKNIVPLLKGANFPADIKSSYVWKNPALGEYAVSVKERRLDFFDPFFILDGKSGEKSPTVCLSALALNLEKLEERSFVVDKGNFYEHEKEEFLKNNPGKTEKDFEPPEIRLTKKSFRMLIASEFSSEYEIVASIEKIEHSSFLGTPVHILTVNLDHTDLKEYFQIPLYVTDKTLNGYVPKIGDAVSAVVWFEGYFN